MYRFVCNHNNQSLNRAKGLGAPDLARVAQAEADFEFVLSYYDGLLENQNYIAGDELTLTDLFHLPNGAALYAGKWKELFEKYPNTLRWFKSLQQRSTWLKAAEMAKTIA